MIQQLHESSYLPCADVNAAHLPDEVLDIFRASEEAEYIWAQWVVMLEIQSGASHTSWISTISGRNKADRPLATSFGRMITSLPATFQAIKLSVSGSQTLCRADVESLFQRLYLHVGKGRLHTWERGSLQLLGEVPFHTTCMSLWHDHGSENSMPINR